MGTKTCVLRVAPAQEVCTYLSSSRLIFLYMYSCMYSPCTNRNMSNKLFWSWSWSWKKYYSDYESMVHCAWFVVIYRNMKTLAPEAGISDRISNYNPQFTVGCNYLSLPEWVNTSQWIIWWRKGSLVSALWHPITALCHDDVIKWKHFPRYWPFVWGIHRAPVNPPLKWPVARSVDILFDLRLNKR